MKIGLIGAGYIAELIAPALVGTEVVECYAVASRDLEKAEAFAKKYGFQKAYGSYEELVEDPEVELVYVGTPHSYHYAHMKLAIENGKNVLCEKAFTLNSRQAREIHALAQEKGVFLAEAIWTRYMPSRKIIDEAIASGIIGKVNTLTANLSYPIAHKERIQSPELGGGTLLDVGVYGLNFALMHFGVRIARVESSVQKTETGVDAMETINIYYKDGRMAVLNHSMYCRGDRKGIIHGDKGYLVVENINNPQSVMAYDTDDKLIAVYPIPKQINGYEYEFIECDRLIKEGKLESESMPMDETIFVMSFMDLLRSQWGVVYPQEEE